MSATMKQAIAGVAPAGLTEVTVMTVLPSTSYYAPIRWLGSLMAINAGVYIFRVGNLIALASIPLAIPFFFLRFLPFSGVRYRLTNRRLIVESAMIYSEQKSVALDRFDSVEIEVLEGQEWFNAGDLIFKLGEVETFRLDAVSRPETFRRTCLEAQRGFVGVKNALATA